MRMKALSRMGSPAIIKRAKVARKPAEELGKFWRVTGDAEFNFRWRRVDRWFAGCDRPKLAVTPRDTKDQGP